MKAEKYKIKTKDGVLERIRLTNMNAKEIISLAKLNTSVVILGTDKNGLNVGALQLKPFPDQGEGLKREYWFEFYDIKKDKKDVKKGEATTEDIMGMITKISTSPDVKIQILMNKEQYDKYTELIMCFRNINNDLLKHALYFDYDKDKTKHLGIYEIRYPWINSRPRVRYFFRENSSLLTFDKKGFNIEKIKGMNTITDVLCG